MMYRGLQQSAAYMASAQEGKSMDRWVRNASKQMGDYRALKTLKQDFDSIRRPAAEDDAELANLQALFGNT